MTGERPTTAGDQRAGRFFHHFADTFDSLYDGKRGPIWRFLDAQFRRDIVERFELTFQRLGELRGKTVLDIGCGSGVYMREALSRGAARVIGLDAAPRMLDLAEQRVNQAGGGERCELITATYPSPPSEAVGKVDAAIVMGVMDYVPDAVGFLSALRAQLGGTGGEGLAAISFPSWHWLRSPVRQVRYQLRNCPIYLYNQTKIEDVLRAAKLVPVKIEKIRGAGQDFHVTVRP